MFIGIKQTMKNPFVKHDNTTLIASLAIGSVAAGAAAYLFMTERGSSMRRSLMERFGFMRRDPIQEDNHNDYMKKPRKQPKTDRDELISAHHDTAGGHDVAVN